MKTSINYRNIAAKHICKYRCNYLSLKKQSYVTVMDLRHNYILYRQISLLYDMGIVSIDCKNRADRMYCKMVRYHFFGGENNGGNK